MALEIKDDLEEWSQIVMHGFKKCLRECGN